MISASADIRNKLNSPVRHISAKAELYNNSVYADTSYTENDRIKSIVVDRIGENSKFFGFGISHKLTLKLIDKDRELGFTTANSFKILFDEVNCLPLFNITEVNRDETTNELSITAYDVLNEAAKHSVSELQLEAPYTISQFAAACAEFLGTVVLYPALDVFNLSYEDGANFDGGETIREALNAIAEATQTIYFIDYGGRLVFKRLEKDGGALFTIDKEKYFDLNSKTNKRLGAICFATELGDNITASTTEAGSTQFVRDNGFVSNREDKETLLNNALAAVGGLTINQFSCSWRGNYLLEIGDKINLITKDNNTVSSFVLIDSINYDGTYSQQTKWDYADNDTETASNPVSIGDALKQTYAKVDKINKEIDLVASEATANGEAISAIQVNTESISATVKKVETQTSDAIADINDKLATLTSRVEASITEEDIRFLIEKELAEGVDKVTTSTGFTFNEDGMTVSKSGSEMTTTITEDGMTVYRDDEAVLIADNQGVKAEDLHATTYLIIGTNSRFEDYKEIRTACFYIGGN